MALSRGVRLGHVNLEVRDLDRARAFYDAFLGTLGFLRLPRTGPFWLGYRKGQVTVWITAGSPPRAKRAGPHVPTTGAADPISDHLGFYVPTVRQLRGLGTRLRRAGFRPVYPLSRVPTAGRTWYVSSAWQDADHNVMELYTVIPRG